jgi:transcriptional regulator with XRE-family HTH domain
MSKRKATTKSIKRHQEIGARLRYLRESLNLSLDDVRRLLKEPELSRTTIQRWETGENAISIDRLERLADMYGVNPGNLLGYS